MKRIITSRCYKDGKGKLLLESFQYEEPKQIGIQFKQLKTCINEAKRQLEDEQVIGIYITKNLEL